MAVTFFLSLALQRNILRYASTAFPRSPAQGGQNPKDPLCRPLLSQRLAERINYGLVITGV